MLSGCPVKVGWNRDASKAIVFDGDLGFLTNAILETGTNPGVDVAWDIYSGGGDEIVPVNVLLPTLYFGSWCFLP